ncbi:Bud site selection protein 6 [Pseudogymnoascus destructans]|uniref:Bud site selection protein 6 n=1 Tax=Pseudogymnoascus destructans TaxID=655981 RepID=A0A177AE74_9PEZI|nr:Bud site selection protein 6 [Pseudogymnoascus destructans]OAF59474.2 Bud site selection protein 6 [Pseudogymnoascus destructans]
MQGATHGTNSGPPLSQIEKSVTHLLVATKQLLETLTRWSRHEATDTNVSDVYVRLGYEFNIACRAFAAIGVDTSDLGNVPELLREILESTLSQEASPEGLDRYLPKIRDIIITLLHGLKRKQQKLRQKQSKESSSHNSEINVPRNTSTSSVASANTGITTLLNEGIDPNYMPDDRMIVDGKVVTKPEVNQVPPRGSSMSTSPQRRGVPQRGLSSRHSMSSEHSSLSSTTMQNMPVLAPFSGDEAALPPRPGSGDLTMDAFPPPPPPPPPPPKQNALAALQRGGDLERRASRRYSAYHISKHLGAQAPMPMLPPQNSPIPNRGRDLRETMNAVRGRGSTVHSKQLSTSPVITEENSNRVPSRISETTEPSSTEETPSANTDQQNAEAKTPQNKGRKASNDLDWQGSAEANRISGATLQGPPTGALPVFAPGLYEAKENDAPSTPITAARQSPTTYTGPSENREFVPEQSPQPGKELTLFLQYKTRIKKFVMADGYNDLSMARLQLAFIEKFAWNTHNNGVDLPEIYIQDPVSGVRHELEDLSDIKDRSVLVLNVEALDEVKRHIDEGLGGLRKMVEGVKIAIDDQKATMQRVSERQQDAAKEITRLSMMPQIAAPLPEPSARGIPPHSPKNEGNKADINELQSLRRNLAVVRQTFSSFQANMESSMSAIRTKASSVSDAAIRAAVPNMKNDSGRSYVNTGKKTLNDDSDKLVGRVDDLQDIVEDLRKDVVLRGVRPLPRQLEGVAKDLSIATQELRKMQEFLKRERPIWTKIWEKELETVCNDREELTMQEDLATDLQDDLEKATQTFALVEQATKEQMKDLPGGNPGGRVPLKSLNHVTLADPTVAKEGVLGEVRALQPNHEGRLEAIERAEKLRQKELEGRKGGEFQKELGNFVEGGKLKKAGGFEEVERARKAKDEKARREVWERQNGITQADADIAPHLPRIALEGEDELGVQEDQPPVI